MIKRALSLCLLLMCSGCGLLFDAECWFLPTAHSTIKLAEKADASALLATSIAVAKEAGFDEPTRNDNYRNYSIVRFSTDRTVGYTMTITIDNPGDEIAIAMTEIPAYCMRSLIDEKELKKVTQTISNKLVTELQKNHTVLGVSYDE